jgi:dipeptidyl aminopeptidase/acylaminoacyl peptidase
MLINVPIHRPKLLKFSPNGRFLAVTTTPHGTILVWNLKARQEHMLLHHSSLVDSIAFSPDGQWLATAATNDPSMTLRDSGRASLRASRVPLPARTEPRPPEYLPAILRITQVYLGRQASEFSTPRSANTLPPLS